MAIDSIPPYLDVNPGVYVSALEGGTRAGLGIAELAQRRQEEANKMSLSRQELGQGAQEKSDQLALERDKLQSGLKESALDRALKQRLSQQEMELNANKFNVGTALDIGSLKLRNLAEQRQEQALKDKEKLTADKASLTADKATRQAEFIKELNAADTIDKMNKFASDHADALADPNSSSLKLWQAKFNHLSKTAPGVGVKETRRTQMYHDRPIGPEVITRTGPMGSFPKETDHMARPGTGGKEFNYDPKTGKLVPVQSAAPMPTGGELQRDDQIAPQ